MHIDSLSINELLVVVGAMISLPTRSVLSDAVIFIHTRPPPPPPAKYLPEPGASQRVILLPPIHWHWRPNIGYD